LFGNTEIDIELVVLLWHQ